MPSGGGGGRGGGEGGGETGEVPGQQEPSPVKSHEILLGNNLSSPGSSLTLQRPPRSGVGGGAGGGAGGGGAGGDLQVSQV